MSQNRNIMEFFKKAPPKAPAPKRAALPEKISKNPPRSKSSSSMEPGDSITVVPISVTSTRSKSARPMAAPRKPTPPIVKPTTSRQGTTLCQSSSSSLSSLPSSSLFQQSQPELHTDRSSSPPPPITTVDSESDDAKSSPSSISNNHWLQQSQSSLPKTAVDPALVSKAAISNNRIIQDSDDEDDESDSDSLPDILADFKSKGQTSSALKTATPMTPPRPSRGKKTFNFHSSPLTVQPKYAFDMKSLIKQSKLDDAAEEKAKRLKTMMEPAQDVDADSVMSDDVGDDEVVDHDNMVDMLVGDSEGSEAENRKAVLRRATGTVTEMSFYFFETQVTSLAQRRECPLSEPAQPVSSTVGPPIFDCICGDPGDVDDYTDSIACDTCKKWQHRKCVIPAGHQAEPQEEALKPQRRTSRKRMLDELRSHNGLGHIEQEDKIDAPPTVRAASARLIVFTCTSCKEKKELAEKARYGRLGLSFPVHAVTIDWKNELEDPKVRRQSFTSGFAENMVRLGRALPHELFMWLLDELCFEGNDLLRHSYCGVLENCPREQTHRLLQPEVVQSLFRKLGGTAVNTSFTEKIRPVKEVPDPYPARDWANLRSIVEIFGRLAHNLRQKTRVSVICLLLRMGADNTVMNNVDLLYSVHTTLSSLCDSVPKVFWESCCREVSRALFTSVQEAALRYQITKCIPSTTPETCDLRRRFAAASFFENISLCDKDMFLNNDINKYTNYLNEPQFKVTANTDFHELAALISLLDIAIDDGQYSGLDLDDKKIVKEHNKDIQILGTRIKAIWQKITPTVSKTLHLKIEAKTSMELVNHRIDKILPIPIKTKPKKDFLLSLRKGYEDVEEEKAGMAKWVKKKPALLKTEDDDLEDPQLVELLRRKEVSGI